MKIGIVVNEFPVVSETFITGQVEALARKGYELFIYCSKLNKILWNEYFSRFKNITPVLLSNKAFLKYCIRHPLSVIRYSEKKGIYTDFLVHQFNKADILHLEFSGIAINYLDAMRKLKCGKMVSCRGSGEKVKLLTDKKRSEKMKQMFGEVNAIHCVSKDMMRTISRFCNQTEKIFINYTAPDSALFQRNQPYEFRQPVNILSIGRLNFQKGYLVGLLAIKKLKESYTDFIWQIAGDGPDKEEIIFHINEMKLQQYVQLLGTQSRTEIIALYNHADIFFLPSVYEGIANVVLEAMSMEIPVVSSDCGGMNEVIVNEANGLLCNNYDYEHMAESLLKLCCDFERRKELGENARKTILENFTIKRNIYVFETQYSKLMHQ